MNKSKQKLELNKRTIAHLNIMQMSQVIGGFEDLPAPTIEGETCIDCPTMECQQQTTRDMGITPGPTLG